jgi:hypothetical protein
LPIAGCALQGLPRHLLLLLLLLQQLLRLLLLLPWVWPLAALQLR